MARPSVPGTGEHPAAPAGGDTILAVVHDDGTGHHDSLDAAGREVRYRGWKAMPFVIGNETFEKLGSIGTAANLMVYLTSVFHMTNLRAAVALNVFGGTTNLATVFGAFASDLCLGRYATVGFGCVATLIGMIILTLTAGVPALHPPPCSAVPGGQRCAGATKGQLAVLALSFLFIVVGAGGIRPCSLPFGADQFDPNTESGRRGINSFFNWYYFTLTIAVVGSSTGIIYVQSNVSWCIGFAIPAALMFASCVLFFAGAGLYVRVRPEGGIPLASVFRVAVAAARKRCAPAPQDPAASLFRTRHASSLVSRLPYTDRFRFLDKAAVVKSDSEVVDDSSGGGGGKPRDPWRLCSLQQVEEAKCVLRIMPVWATCIVYYVAFAQTNTYVVLQAAQSDRRLGPGGFEAPPASFTIFPMLALAVWIPFYDRLVVPWLRGLTGVEGGMTLLPRMGVGMALSVVAMLVAGVVEQRRRELAVLHQAEANRDLLSVTLVSPASAFWLVPQLAALGLSEAFNQVSQMEFYYKQFPENMRSVAGSLIFTGLAMSMYLSGLLVVVVHRATADPVLGDDGWLAENLNRGKLDWFYFLIAFIGAVNFFVFLACAKWYRYKGLDDGERGGADDDGVHVHVHVHQWQPTTVQVVDDCPEEGRVVRRRSF